MPVWSGIGQCGAVVEGHRSLASHEAVRRCTGRQLHQVVTANGGRIATPPDFGAVPPWTTSRPTGDVRVSAWSIALDPDRQMWGESQTESWRNVAAWAQEYCRAAGNEPCEGIIDRAVPLCLERRDEGEAPSCASWPTRTCAEEGIRWLPANDWFGC